MNIIFGTQRHLFQVRKFKLNNKPLSVFLKTYTKVSISYPDKSGQLIVTQRNEFVDEYGG